MSSKELDQYIRAFEEATGSPLPAAHDTDFFDEEGPWRVKTYKPRWREPVQTQKKANVSHTRKKSQTRSQNHQQRLPSAPQRFEKRQKEQQTQQGARSVSPPPPPPPQSPPPLPPQSYDSAERDVRDALRRAAMPLDSLSVSSEEGDSDEADSLAGYFEPSRHTHTDHLALDHEEHEFGALSSPPLQLEIKDVVASSSPSSSSSSSPKNDAVMSTVDSLLQEFKRGLDLPGVQRSTADIRLGENLRGREIASATEAPRTLESASAYSWTSAPGGNASPSEEAMPPGREILRMGAWSLSVIDSEQAQVFFTNRQTGHRQSAIPSATELGPLQRVASQAIIQHLYSTYEHAAVQTIETMQTTKTHSRNATDFRERPESSNDAIGLPAEKPQNENLLHKTSDIAGERAQGAEVTTNQQKKSDRKPGNKSQLDAHDNYEDTRDKNVETIQEGSEEDQRDNASSEFRLSALGPSEDDFEGSPESGEFDSVYLRCIEHLELLNTFSQSTIAPAAFSASRLTILGADVAPVERAIPSHQRDVRDQFDTSGEHGEHFNSPSDQEFEEEEEDEGDEEEEEVFEDFEGQEDADDDQDVVEEHSADKARDIVDDPGAQVANNEKEEVFRVQEVETAADAHHLLRRVAPAQRPAPRGASAFEAPPAGRLGVIGGGGGIGRARFGVGAGSVWRRPPARASATSALAASTRSSGSARSGLSVLHAGLPPDLWGD